MKIVFPELNNPIINEAVARERELDPSFEAVPAEGLEAACNLCKNGSADAMIAGIDHTTRDVVLACKDHLGATGETFSSCFVMKRAAAIRAAVQNHLSSFPATPDTLIVADAGVTKNPTVEQLTDIIIQTYETALRVLDEEPKIAMLSFSTFGSAKDESIDKITSVIERVRSAHPEINIDGEMQLDCAVNPVVAAKKAPNSPVAGYANVLIVPDLNSGNILYKSLEQFAGYTAAGPILQGFLKPVSDLSRGSTVEDVRLVIETMKKLI